MSLLFIFSSHLFVLLFVCFSLPMTDQEMVSGEPVGQNSSVFLVLDK